MSVTKDNIMRKFDVVIVGASIAGCTAALRYAEFGLKIAILDLKKSSEAYKSFCTHFIQPSALPVLKKLKMDQILETHGAVRTKAAFWTEAGWINPEEDYSKNKDMAYAYNIERQILDPLLCKQLLKHQTITIFYNSKLKDITKTAENGFKIHFKKEEELIYIHANFVVAADGRESTVAKIINNTPKHEENERSAFFGYFENINPPIANRSLFMLSAHDMGFIYPLAKRRTLLSIYLNKNLAETWRKSKNLTDEVMNFFNKFPDIPDLRAARPASEIKYYIDYSNLTRKPVDNGIAFIGDAAMTLDPMSGVGCGFAMVSADLLVTSTWKALKEGYSLEDSLLDYEKSYNRCIYPHAHGIKADSMISKSPKTIQEFYSFITGHEKLMNDFIALTGRIILPKQFQSTYLLARGKQTREKYEHTCL